MCIFTLTCLKSDIYRKWGEWDYRKKLVIKVNIPALLVTGSSMNRQCASMFVYMYGLTYNSTSNEF